MIVSSGPRATHRAPRADARAGCRGRAAPRRARRPSRVASRRVSRGTRPGGSARAGGGPTSSSSGSRPNALDGAARERRRGRRARRRSSAAIPVTPRSSARQISSPASVASVGVASALRPGPSQTVKRSPGAQRVDERGDEVAEAGVLRARRRGAGAVHALHAGDPRDGPRRRARSTTSSRRRLEEAVGVDRVRRLVLGAPAPACRRRPSRSRRARPACRPRWRRRRRCASRRRSRPTPRGGRASSAAEVVPDRGVDDRVGARRGDRSRTSAASVRSTSAWPARRTSAPWRSREDVHEVRADEARRAGDADPHAASAAAGATCSP